MERKNKFIFSLLVVKFCIQFKMNFFEVAFGEKFILF